MVDLRRDLLAIAQAGVRAVDAGTLLTRALRTSRTLDATSRLSVLAAGKAAVRMMATAEAALGPRIGARVVAAGDGHPLPTATSERDGRAALAMASAVAADELLLVLLSGGASALMAVPADGLSLEDKRATTQRLLRGGADIHALNAVRKHLSAVKGGRLAACAPRSVTFAISDVIDDDTSVIGSGPTVADATTFADALAVLDRFGGRAGFPARVVQLLEAGAAGNVAETPKPGDPRLAHAETLVIGSRLDAAAGAAADARARGYHTITITEPVVGEARAAAAAHLRHVAELTRGATRPVCVVSSGETTVLVTGTGRGGRNQEFALAAAEGLEGFGTPVALASVGTDGVDGPTSAAGALADSTTLQRARAAGLDAGTYLANNDSFNFFDGLGDLVQTGPTGTNVGDLQIFLIA